MSPLPYLEDLKNHFKSDQILTDPEDLSVYAYDGTAALHQMPACVIMAETIEQVAHILKLAQTHYIPVVTRGSGTGVLATPKRTRIRNWTLNGLFTSPKRLHLLGRLMRIYQKTGLQTLVRKSGLLHLLPKSLRELEPLTPTISSQFTQAHFKRYRAI